MFHLTIVFLLVNDKFLQLRKLILFITMITILTSVQIHGIKYMLI